GSTGGPDSSTPDRSPCASTSALHPHAPSPPAADGPARSSSRCRSRSRPATDNRACHARVCLREWVHSQSTHHTRRETYFFSDLLVQPRPFERAGVALLVRTDDQLLRHLA